MSFKALEGDTVLLVQNGARKTADLYERDGAPSRKPFLLESKSEL
jgi:hypothetical protein